MGEHAAVYGRPALVTSLSLRMEARLEWCEGHQVELDLPQLNIQNRLPWRDLLEYTARVRHDWETYAQNPSPESFARVRGTNPAHLVLVALGETAQALKQQKPPGLKVRLSSQLPVGSGFGSSAAAAVALIGGYLHGCGEATAPDRVQSLALEAERRQHGFPSGVDTAAATLGGLLEARRNESNELEIHQLQVPTAHLEAFSLFDSGSPQEDTGTVVAAVRQRFADQPRARESLLNRMDEATARFHHALSMPQGGGAVISSSMTSFQRCLEEMGVVPEPVQRLVRDLEAAGAAAKISGAGSLTGSGAGSLLVYHEDRVSPVKGSVLKNFPHLPGSLGGEGLRLDASL